MASDRELLENSMERIRTAVTRGTGTSLSAEEVQVVGGLLYAFGSSVLPNLSAREACAVCGRPEHPEAAVGEFPRHAYEPGLLVPLITREEEEDG